MRNYLYLWHDPAAQMMVASGIEFHDFLPILQDASGVLLLKGKAMVAQHDAQSGLLHVPRRHLAALASDDMASWGSHAWADYAGASLAGLDEAAVAEAKFFALQGAPMRQPQIAALRNRYLAYAHDDGWYLKLFYSDWGDVARWLAGAIPATLGTLDLPALRRGDDGYWLKHGVVQAEIKTHDIDSVLNRRL